MGGGRRTRPADLLVLGQSGGLLRRRLRGSVPAYCARKAGCPVLTVPAPELLHELEAMNRRTRWHLPVGEMSELLFVKG